MGFGSRYTTASSSVSGKTAKQLDVVALVIVAVITVALAVTWPSDRSDPLAADRSTLLDGTVSSLSPCREDTATSTCVVLDVEPSTGSDAGQVFRTPEVHDVTFSVGDKIVLRSTEQPDSGFRYAYEDHQRLGVLAVIGAIVAAGLLLVGWRSGLRTMAALGATTALLYYYTLPALSDDPGSMTVGILSSVSAATLLILGTGGITASRTIATIGSIVSLVAVGCFSWLALLLAELPTNLLLTGITLGSVGAVVTLSTSQADATFDMRDAKAPSSITRLARSSIRANQSRVSSTLLTLVFAILGAGLAALVVFATADQPALQTLNSVAVASLALSILGGSAGLLVAVPTTAVLAACLPTRAAAEPRIMLDDRPPLRRRKPAPESPRRRRQPAPARARVTTGEPSLWERMRQGLDE